MKTAFFWIVIFVGYLLISSNINSNSSKTSSSYSPPSTLYNDQEIETEPEEEYRVTSDNWECTEDCSGHDAGYEWASENGITDPYDCDGNSDSFIEGCEAYANEYQIEQETYESEEDEYYDDYDYR